MRTLPHVDRVGVEERAALLAKRSIKTDVEGRGHPPGDLDDRPDDARGPGHAGQGAPALRQGRLPGAAHPEVPSCAAVCVYPTLVAVAREALAGSGVTSPSVATGFPSGQARSTCG